MEHPAQDTTAAALSKGAFPLTREDFRAISAILHEDAGIFLSDAKETLVYSRLTIRLRALGLESFRQYCALVSSREGLSERQRMIAALTTNVTKFFREPHHFEHLKTHVLAPNAQRIRKGGRLRIWSAACSDGQEPYSIAISILSLIPEAPQLDVRVLATDIDANMIAAGIAGRYNGEAMSAVPQAMRESWFQPVGKGGAGEWRASPALASLVAFRELNLVGKWPMKGRFDAIFCRNVVIYFEEKTQQQMWSRFLPLMTSDARLYIGHSERVSGPALEHLVGEGITAYRFRDGAGA